MEGTTALAVKGAPSATSNGHSIPIRAIPRIRSISLTCCEKRMGLCALSMTRMSLASFYARRGSGCFVKPDLNRAPSQIPGAVKCSFVRSWDRKFGNWTNPALQIRNPKLLIGLCELGQSNLRFRNFGFEMQGLMEGPPIA